jgi:hypothetical protein
MTLYGIADLAGKFAWKYGLKRTARLAMGDWWLSQPSYRHSLYTEKRCLALLAERGLQVLAVEVSV